MKLHSDSSKHRCGSGFTIIEMMVYIVLLSGILTILVPYIYMTNEQNLKLIAASSAAV